MPRALLLPTAFYNRHVTDVARDLLGKLLVRQSDEGTTSGRIVEVEAYLAQDDDACHASRGKTPRNAVMFERPGLAYVYSIHARWCFNVVADREGVASAVLIRAVEPLQGIELMQRRRAQDDTRNLTRGPARLCEAMQIDRSLNGCRLTNHAQLAITDDGWRWQVDQIGQSPRIGVTSARSLPLRFFVRDSPWLSGPKRLNQWKLIVEDEKTTSGGG